jgi:hypothetical protein
MFVDDQFMPQASSPMTPPPSGGPGIFGFRSHSFSSPQEAQDFLQRSGITQGFSEMQAARRASQAERGLGNNANTALSNQVYEQGPTVIPDGQGGYRIQTDQGTHNWSGPRLMEAMARFGDADTQAQIAAWRANPGTFAASQQGTTTNAQGQTVLAPTQAQQRALDAQAGYAAQAAAHPANQPGAARFDSAGASQMPGGSSQATTSAATGNAAGGSAAPPPTGAGTAADQARILRQQRGQPVTVTRR